MKIRPLVFIVVVFAFSLMLSSRDNLSPTWAQDATAAATQNPDNPVPDAQLQYKVAFVAANDYLNVRVTSGTQAGITDKLQNGEIVQPLNAGQDIDGALWIPILYRNRKEGWVNRFYLIATRDTHAFCNDDRPKALIAALQDAVQHLDSQKLADLVAPRGLYLALDGEKTLFLSPAEVRGFFEDFSPRSWGRNGNTDQEVTGTLPGKVTQLMQKNLTPTDVSVQIACNDNQDSLSTRITLNDINIPGDEISNFYSVLRPGANGDDLDWGAWGLAIEYWAGQPALTGMVYYHWTP